MKHRRLYCYTLVEVVAVMAIIAILAGLGTKGYQVVKRQLATTRTQATLAKLNAALHAYKSEFGYFPLKNSGITSTSEQQHNAGVPFYLDSNSGAPNFNTFIDYANFKRNSCFQTDGLFYVRDAWSGGTQEAGLSNAAKSIANKVKSGGVILYRCPGVVNPNSFDLYTAGNDRVFGTKDDIYAE